MTEPDGDDVQPPKEGTLCSISMLRTADLGLVDEPQWFYSRPAMIEQWTFMVSAFDNRKTPNASGELRNHLNIGGPPGTGKSSTTWHWSRWLAKTHNINVLWIRKTGAWTIRVVTNNGVIKYRFGTSYSSPDQRFECIIQQLHVCTVCVFDGATGKSDGALKSMLETWLTSERSERFLVYCTSGALFLKTEVLAQTHSVPSWLLDEYASACALDDFWTRVVEVFEDHAEDDTDDDAGLDQVQSPDSGDLPLGADLDNVLTPNSGDVPLGAGESSSLDALRKKHPKRSSAIEEKFYWVGQCARWMFMNKDKAIEDIHGHFRMVKNLTELLAQHLGEGSSVQVNHLRALLVDGDKARHVFLNARHVFVSKYVLGLLSKHKDVTTDFMADLNRFAMRSTNPTFIGWCIEFDFLMQVRNCSAKAQPLAVQYDSMQLELNVGKIHTFDDIVDVEELTGLSEGDWLLPDRWNHAAQLVRKNGQPSVRFYNVTFAASHDLKCRYLLGMMKALVAAGWLKEDPVASLAFWFMRVNFDDKEFTVGSLTSDKALCKEFSWDKKIGIAFFTQTTTE